MLWHAVGVDTRRHDRSGDLDRRRDQSSGRLCLRNFRTGSTAVSSARRRSANTTATNSTPGAAVSFLRAPLRPIQGHYAGGRSQVATTISDQTFLPFDAVDVSSWP